MTAHLGETGINPPSPEFAPSYDLSSEQVQVLSGQLLTERPPSVDDKLVCYHLSGHDEFSNIARHVEVVVFDDTFKNDAEVMEKEYGPYEEASEFFLLMDQETKLPAGALRVIKNSPAGLKTLNDIQDEPLKVSVESFVEHHRVDSLDFVEDVGTLALLPEYRQARSKSQEASIMLYRALYVRALQDGIKHFVSVMNNNAHASLRLLGVPFVPICDTQPFKYLDYKESDAAIEEPIDTKQLSTALYGYVPDFYDTMEARLKGLRRSMSPKRQLFALFLRKPLSQLMDGKGIDDRLLFDNE